MLSKNPLKLRLVREQTPTTADLSINNKNSKVWYTMGASMQRRLRNFFVSLYYIVRDYAIMFHFILCLLQARLLRRLCMLLLYSMRCFQAHATGIGLVILLFQPTFEL